MTNHIHTQYGFSLIEALVAMFVLSIGIGAIYSMQITAIQGNAKASVLTNASSLGMEKVEELIERYYDDVIDTDNDGEPGLNDTCGSDELEVSDDDRYTLYTNIAEDIPVEGCKTVHILVRDNRESMKNTIVFKYIKEGTI